MSVSAQLAAVQTLFFESGGAADAPSQLSRLLIEGRIEAAVRVVEANAAVPSARAALSAYSPVLLQVRTRHLLNFKARPSELCFSQRKTTWLLRCAAEGMRRGGSLEEGLGRSSAEGAGEDRASCEATQTLALRRRLQSQPAANALCLQKGFSLERRENKPSDAFLWL